MASVPAASAWRRASTSPSRRAVSATSSWARQTFSSWPAAINVAVAAFAASAAASMRPSASKARPSIVRTAPVLCASRGSPRKVSTSGRASASDSSDLPPRSSRSVLIECDGRRQPHSLDRWARRARVPGRPPPVSPDRTPRDRAGTENGRNGSRCRAPAPRPSPRSAASARAPDRRAGTREGPEGDARADCFELLKSARRVAEPLQRLGPPDRGLVGDFAEPALRAASRTSARVASAAANWPRSRRRVAWSRRSDSRADWLDQRSAIAAARDSASSAAARRPRLNR